MVFGTDRFFNHLKNGIISDGSETFYSDVLKTIERDAYPRIMSRLNYPDAEDVMQQVLLSVWTSLAKYVMTSENLMPQQRNAWLIRIIDNKIADYYRKRYATIEISCDDTERVFDELIKNDPQEAFVLEEDRRLHQRQVDNLMCFICSINMIPEKIIAFFYSKVIYFIQSNGDLKGSAKYAYKMLNGRTFAEIQSSFQFDLEAALGREIPPYALEGLYEKLNACDLDTILKIELSTINDSTNYIIKRIRNVDKSSVLEVK